MTEYKITLARSSRIDCWLVNIFERENDLYRGPGEWRCILSHDTYRLAAHVDAKIRLRQVMRSLA